MLSTCVPNETRLRAQDTPSLGVWLTAVSDVGRDHLHAQAKSRLSSCRWRAAMNLSDLENQNDDIPQATPECADTRKGTAALTVQRSCGVIAYHGPMTHFPHYGLSGCVSILFVACSRLTYIPACTHISFRAQTGAIDAGTAEVGGQVPPLLSRHETSSRSHPTGTRERLVFNGFRCRLSILTPRVANWAREMTCNTAEAT